MAKWIVEIVGWVGALSILASYALMTLRRIAPDSAAYQWLNLVGAVGMLVNSLWNGAYPPAFLNVVWFLIAGYALSRARQPAPRER